MLQTILRQTAAALDRAQAAEENTLSTRPGLNQETDTFHTYDKDIRC